MMPLRIRIRDNGISIDAQEFVSRLLAIGYSKKRGAKLRGFRGIGRLAGLAYCQELVFRGRTKSAEPVSEVSWNARKLKELLNSHDDLRDLQTAVKEIAAVNRLNGSSYPSRFFEVELRKVIRIKNDVLINPEAVSLYLSQVGPVPFRTDFKYQGEIREFLNIHGVGVEAQIIVNGGAPLTRPHQSAFALNPKILDRFSGIKFFKIPGLENDLDAAGWVLDHGYMGAIPKSQNIGGLRLRAGNIQIGEQTVLADLFREPRFNSWCVGEFHILNEKILPNGRRDEFEYSPLYSNVQAHISQIANEITRICRARSGTRNLLKATTESLQRIEKDLAIVRSIPNTFPFRAKYVNTLAELIRKHELTLATRWPQESEERDVLLRRIDSLRRKMDRTVAENHVNSLLSKIAPAKKKAYSEVLSAIYEVSSNPSVAHDYVKKIIKQLEAKE